MKIVLILLPVIILGVVGFLAFSGKINIPGITPKKALKNALAMYGADGKDSKVAADATKKASAPPAPKADAKKPKVAKAPPTKDPEQGADALATVWNGVKPPELIAITKDWKDQDLVRVLMHMDGDKVSKFLDLMAKGDEDNNLKGDPGRASKISKVLQEQESIIKAPATST